MYIEDGKGKNGKASVDANQKLEVSSETASILYHKSKTDSSVYVLYAKRDHAAGTGTNENIFHMEYTGNGTLCIAKAVCASNSTLAKIEFYKNPTYTSGGATVVPVNLNFSSAIPASVTAYHGGTTLVMSVDSTLEMMDVRLSTTGDTTETIDFEGCVRMQKGDTFGALGEVASAGEKIRLALYFWEE